MRVKTALFCSLSTSAAFQSWLFKFDEAVYKSFAHNLRESKGCDENKKLMLVTLEQIESSGGGSYLEEFLKTKYPHVLDTPRGTAASKDTHNVFGGQFIQGILTYPRREIIRGNIKTLERDVKRFLVSKISTDYLIIDDTAYIEYLLPGEEDHKIPEKSWKIKAYRKDNS